MTAQGADSERRKSWLESEEHATFCEWHWNDKDCGKDLVLHRQKTGVTFHPNKSNGCVVIRGDKVLKLNMEHYFEVELKGPFHGQARQVGVGTKHTALQSNNCDFYPLIGKDISSWGVNYNGYKSNSGHTKRHVNIDPDKHDIIKVGVHYDSYYGTVAFEVNGKSSGLAFERVRADTDMYPMLCASSPNTQMRLVYSSSSVISLKGACRGVIRSSITTEKDIEKLILPTPLKSYLLYKTKPSRRSCTVKNHEDGSNYKEKNLNSAVK